VSFTKDVVFGAIGYVFGRRRRMRMPGDVFRRKIVITIHPWAVPVLVLAIALPLVFSFSIISNMVELAITATSLVITWRVIRISQHLQYRVHHILTGMSEEEDDAAYKTWLANMPPDDEDKIMTLKKVNNHGSARVSK
jgi:hypothetical protein